jgi:hypothetical protein
MVPLQKQGLKELCPSCSWHPLPGYPHISLLGVPVREVGVRKEERNKRGRRRKYANEKEISVKSNLSEDSSLNPGKTIFKEINFLSMDYFCGNV